MKKLTTRSVGEFLVDVIKLENEAATRFGQLADAMGQCGNREIGRLFRRLSDYLRCKRRGADALDLI